MAVAKLTFRRGTSRCLGFRLTDRLRFEWAESTEFLCRDMHTQKDQGIAANQIWEGPTHNSQVS